MSGGKRRALGYVGGVMLLLPLLLWVVGRTFFTIGPPAGWLPWLWAAAGCWLLAGAALLFLGWRPRHAAAE